MLRKTKKHIGWFLICCGLLHQASAQNTDKKYNSPGDWTQAFALWAHINTFVARVEYLPAL
jgi:hypothetical protein